MRPRIDGAVRRQLCGCVTVKPIQVSCSAPRACDSRQKRTETPQITMNTTWSRQPPQTSRRPRTPETCRPTHAHSVRICALMHRRSARQRGTHARTAGSTRGCSCSEGQYAHQAQCNARPVAGCCHSVLFLWFFFFFCFHLVYREMK
jgi:hypothetical protein